MHSGVFTHSAMQFSREPVRRAPDVLMSQNMLVWGLRMLVVVGVLGHGSGVGVEGEEEKDEVGGWFV